MTLVVPNNPRLKERLEARGVDCVESAAAELMKIRPLRIGILNIMPKAQEYEVNLLEPLGRPILQIEPVWIRLKTHVYRSTPHSHLDSLYVTFEEAAEKGLDALIVTGAPVELMDYEQVWYWDELEKIVSWAQEHCVSTLGICWGGLALAGHLGIGKTIYPRKIFGVYKIRNLAPENPLVAGLDDVFDCPQSRFAGIDDAKLEAARDEGKLNLLAWSAATGYVIFETPDHKLVMHLGHPEYVKRRLVDETLRDRKKGRTDVSDPVGFDLERPRNTWRAHRNAFFSSWVKMVYRRALGIEA